MINSDCAINALRMLAVDAVEKAKSGHPGTPMGAAPMAYALWCNFLRHAPSDPNWFNRDRFVLSCGHASMLLYGLLHLSGYEVSIDDLAHFRSLGSTTPGHPELGVTPGVEATTGPLGQGFANAVGMALAERMMANEFNRDGFPMVDHKTWFLTSDGDMMEGLSSEAASLAGTWRLGKLVCLYDSNGISIEGQTSLAFREDVAARFKAYGWNVIGPVNGDSWQAVNTALETVVQNRDRPQLIVCKTTIGYGSPTKAGSSAVHGAALGAGEVTRVREVLNWEHPQFVVPEQAYTPFREHAAIGEQSRAKWHQLLKEYTERFPDLARRLVSTTDARLSPEDSAWEHDLDQLHEQFITPIATRKASCAAITCITKHQPELVGGSADLGPSNSTFIKGRGSFQPESPEGRNLHFGVREHAMAAICNGISAHGGIVPYAGTFLVFSDYSRAAIRLGALSQLKVIWVFSHDSIGVGEDGPTHQPVSQLMSLRLIPNLTVIRPADAAETLEGWRVAMKSVGPVALILTRQDVVTLQSLGVPQHTIKEGVTKGAYIVKDSPSFQGIIIATGSEVAIAIKASELLAQRGMPVRVVSMSSWELFAQTGEEYQRSVLPPSCKARVAVEAGGKLGWEHYTGLEGKIIGMDGYGASGPYREVMDHFDITPEATAKAMEQVIEDLNS